MPRRHELGSGLPSERRVVNGVARSALLDDVAPAGIERRDLLSGRDNSRKAWSRRVISKSW